MKVLGGSETERSLRRPSEPTKKEPDKEDERAREREREQSGLDEDATCFFYECSLAQVSRAN